MADEEADVSASDREDRPQDAGLEPEELGEPMPERTTPQPSTPQSETSRQQSQGETFNSETNLPPEQVERAEPARLEMAAVQEQEAPGQGGSLLHWLGLGGLLTLLSGWWVSRVVLGRGRNDRPAGRTVLTIAE